MFRIMWRAAGSVKLTFGLLVLIAANLGTGSYYVKYCPDVFRMLSHSLVQDWYAGQGRYHSGETWWLWTLLVLGFMLGINTTACTLSRVGGLWPKRKEMGAKAFVFRITPSIVHICFLTMLTGHLLSLTTGFLSVVVIGPGASTALPQQAGVEVLSTHTEYYHAPSPLQGLPRQSEALVRLRAPGETTLRSLSILCPISWRGFSLHLSMDKKAPGSAGLKLFIQRDPGVGVILSGFTALIVLTGWYLLARRRYGG